MILLYLTAVLLILVQNVLIWCNSFRLCAYVIANISNYNTLLASVNTHGVQNFETPCSNCFFKLPLRKKLLFSVYLRLLRVLFGNLSDRETHIDP